MNDELKKLFEVQAELDARELNVSEMTLTELMLYELVLHMRYMRGLAIDAGEDIHAAADKYVNGE
jgi:hypothetical protein